MYQPAIDGVLTACNERRIVGKQKESRWRTRKNVFRVQSYLALRVEWYWDARKVLLPAYFIVWNIYDYPAPNRCLLSQICTG